VLGVATTTAAPALLARQSAVRRLAAALRSVVSGHRVPATNARRQGPRCSARKAIRRRAPWPKATGRSLIVSEPAEHLHGGQRSGRVHVPVSSVRAARRRLPVDRVLGRRERETRWH
jgi:hypothetical protein